MWQQGEWRSLSISEQRFCHSRIHSRCPSSTTLNDVPFDFYRNFLLSLLPSDWGTEGCTKVKGSWMYWGGSGLSLTFVTYRLKWLIFILSGVCPWIFTSNVPERFNRYPRVASDSLIKNFVEDLDCQVLSVKHFVTTSSNLDLLHVLLLGDQVKTT